VPRTSTGVKGGEERRRQKKAGRRREEGGKKAKEGEGRLKKAKEG
jgi:hypothetical protein